MAITLRRIVNHEDGLHGTVRCPLRPACGTDQSSVTYPGGGATEHGRTRKKSPDGIRSLETAGAATGPSAVSALGVPQGGRLGAEPRGLPLEVRLDDIVYGDLSGVKTLSTDMELPSTVLRVLDGRIVEKSGEAVRRMEKTEKSGEEDGSLPSLVQKSGVVFQELPTPDKSDRRWATGLNSNNKSRTFRVVAPSWYWEDIFRNADVE